MVSVPAGIVRMVFLALMGPGGGTPGDTWIDTMKWLVFVDAAGQTVMLIPYNGWNRGI